MSPCTVEGRCIAITRQFLSSALHLPAASIHRLPAQTRIDRPSGTGRLGAVAATDLRLSGTRRPRAQTRPEALRDIRDHLPDTRPLRPATMFKQTGESV